MNKKLIAILTLVMFALTLLPMGAFAASVNTVTGNVPTITDTGANQQLANIRISNDNIPGNFGNGVFTIDLPAGVNWDPTNATTAVSGAINASSLTTGTASTVELSGARTLTVTLATVSPVATGAFILPVVVDVTSVGTGDITAVLTNVSAGITSGEVVVGRFSEGSASARTLSAPSRAGSGSFGVIRITENAAGALATDETITIQLPQKMRWDSPTDVTPVTGTGDLTYVSGDDQRRVTYRVNTLPGSGIRIWDIPTPVTVDSDANMGDIVVTFGGTANVETTTLRIGSLKDFEVEVMARDQKELLAGRESALAGRVVIKEGLAGSVINGRDIRLKLPAGVKFAAGVDPTIHRISGTNVNTTAPSINTDRNEMTFRFGNVSTSAVELEVRGIELALAPNFVGDVKVEISGPAGVTGEAVIANVVKPIQMVISEVADVEIGRQAQKLGDITITEIKAEALLDGTLQLRLPAANAEWGSLPTVEVIEGDLDLGTIARDGRDLNIPIDNTSSSASTIRITNATITTNRTIAEGDFNIIVTNSSTAVVQAGAAMANRNTMLSVRAGTIVTPAVDGTVKPVIMTVGSTVYTVDGVEMTMDVAPYVKGGRTFFPVRFVASAVGISADNVVWDGAQRTVTIFRGNRIVQVTIDSQTMLVNGIPVMMDTAPEITAGRTMLPIRFVAQGLGVNVTWDAATQTVTLN